MKVKCLLNLKSSFQLTLLFDLGLPKQDHGIWSITSWKIDGETVETVSDFIWGAPKSLQMVTAAMKLKDAYSLEEKL